MIKEHKKLLIVTSIITLIPMIVGLLLWSRFPDTMATHFDVNNNPNGWESKGFTVIGIPLFIFVVHLICAFGTAMDPKSKNISRKMYALVLWICPIVSLLCGVTIYGYALGFNVKFSSVAFVLLGVIFIVLGNYLPKCRQNYTVGIKLPWTLADEENWNRTHRLAGWVWTIGGIIVLLNGFINSSILMMVVMIVCVALPTIYSFLLYRKNSKNNN